MVAELAKQLLKAEVALAVHFTCRTPTVSANAHTPPSPLEETQVPHWVYVLSTCRHEYVNAVGEDHGTGILRTPRGLPYEEQADPLLSQGSVGDGLGIDYGVSMGRGIT
ncbi:hypothetical protein VTI74DRAFT_7543 [Chaetomium olivicolor]